MKFDDIMRKVLTMFPEAQLEQDLDGQLIVYTGLECTNSEDDWNPIEEEDSKPEIKSPFWTSP